jgi:XRE family transcriptional regulator, aerobic/anaerobic benzoate catabolism transcriptional regulator
MSSQPDQKHPLLVSMSVRLRACRAEKGLTRKQLAHLAGLSERHLANLETGVGNVSVLVLLQVANALETSMAQLLGDFTTATREWSMLRNMLEHADEATLRKIRHLSAPVLGPAGVRIPQNKRIALIGLRGAGKSSLGQLLATELGFGFVELSREIERLAGGPIAEIQALYGANAYRRYERRAIDQVIRQHNEVVIAIPGGLVMDSATFNEVLGACTTIWLQADPEDHMRRVVTQGDMRPMASSKEAMADLRAILTAREPLYAKADFRLNTSAQSLEATFGLLRHWVREKLMLPLPEALAG